MDNHTYVAVDLGSNSFHMLIVRDDNGSLQVIDKLKVMVQLAAGLNTNRKLDSATRQRALDTMALFGERIKNITNAHIRVVGTSTMRRIRHNADFIDQAEALLGAPIEIISGAEEARLIYIGVCSSLPHDSHHRLVIDIGGGSTEFIIGNDRTPIQLESIRMGCIGFSQQFGKLPLTTSQVIDALTKVELNLQSIQKSLQKKGWQEIIGASGSIKAVSHVLKKLYDVDEITLRHMDSLADYLSQEGMSTEMLSETFGFEPERATVFPGGFLILYAAMKTLHLQRLICSDNAIREGIIVELLGREMARDVRDQSVSALQQRFSVNPIQAIAVSNVSSHLFQQVATLFPPSLEANKTLNWAAKLHEIGLAISHSSHHKHGFYLISQCDMAGFSKTVQYRVAALIGLHRKKFDTTILSTITEKELNHFLLLLSILRLSALLCRSQQTSYRTTELPYLKLSYQPEGEKILLTLSQQWIEQHPLTAADLREEKKIWQADDTATINFDWNTE
jgi:exopolyphosphatase/guanosine-5'-triphosphate,3'-diphosphate pyrophosphatase